MAAEDRRAALIEATVPLLHEHGLDVSTRRIAQAAGVAEGTIFGVFPDKGSLVRAALLQALDPGPSVTALAEIDPGADLRVRLATAADLLLRRFADIAPLMAAARGLAMAPDAAPELHERLASSREGLLIALTAVMEPDRNRLRRSPSSVARLLILLVGATSHGLFGDTDRFSGDEMAELLLDGLIVRPTEHPAPTDEMQATNDRGGPVPC